MKKLILLLTLLTLAGGGGYWYWHSAAKRSPVFHATAVERGDLLATINATGTVEPGDGIGDSRYGVTADYAAPVPDRPQLQGGAGPFTDVCPGV